MKSSSLESIFGEGIVGSSKRPRRMGPQEVPERWVLPLIVLIIFFLVAVARLLDLQVIRGSYFRSLAEGNRIRRIPIKAPRGEILDRNGRALGRNVPVYKLATFGEGGVVAETQEISREEALRIQAEDPEKEARLLVDVGREYPLGTAAAHITGYVNEASPQEVGSKKCETEIKYELGDLVGRTGVEAQYECLLTGINGEELVEVDTRGRLVRRLGRKDPVSGKTIKLSIDADLQQASFRALENAPLPDGGVRPASEQGFDEVRGAVVAQDPGSGDVLALVSAPSFNPNTISRDYSRLAADEDKPLFNRALSGTYPPGSTFKIVTAAAGLAEGEIDENYEYEDTGIVRVGEFSYRNWYFTQYGRTEGFLGVVRAIKRSTDTFFYIVGGMVGVDRLSSWAKNFGLGEKTGIDLPGEASGLVPTPYWKEQVRGERWFLGNTYHMAIGQGDITTTPLQVNVMTSVIASGGTLCTPHVIDEESWNSKFTPRKGASAIQNSKCEDIGVAEETIRLITEGMVGACSPGGTAFPLFNFEQRVACKTGTAEIGVKDKTHAWLTAFAPVDSKFNLEQAQAKLNLDQKPEIVVTTLVENGGEGSRVAAPVIREILDYWFNKR